MIKTILWVSGILAAIAVLIRGSVILGLYLFILPGLILAVAPTIFAYTATFAFLRRTMRARSQIRHPVAVNLMAALLTIGAGVALAAPAALKGRQAFAAAVKTDVGSAAPVPLEGDIRLDRYGYGGPRTPKDACDALCAALLETPGVRSVTLGGTNSTGASVAPITYAVLPKAPSQSATLMPFEPAKIVDHLPKRAGAGRASQWKETMEAEKALRNSVTARWSLRLTGGESLTTQPPPSTFTRTISIVDTRDRGPHRLATQEVEIVDANGGVLFRRQHVTASPIGMPLHFVPGGPMLDRGFEIGRSTEYTGPRHFDFRPIETLFENTTLARPALDDQAVARLRDTAGALAGADGAPVVGPWLATLDWAHLTDADVDVLARLIADPSTTGLERLYDGYAKHVSPRLRQPIAVRLLSASTDDRLRSTLNTLVRNMPPGTYATLLPQERTLLADRGLRLRSSALVARLADQGAAAVPELVQLLNEDIKVEPWAKRQWILADIRRAFSQLGRDASAALPTVERLFELRHTPLTNTWNDAQAWRVAMVRMGKPVETLTFPAQTKPEILARDREWVRTQAERGPER